MMKQSFLKTRVFVLVFLSLTNTLSLADEGIQEPPDSVFSIEGLPKWRLRTFHEFMTPSIQAHAPHVPNPDGSELSPANVFGMVWIDYEFKHNYRLLYSQRSLINLPTLTAPGEGGVGWDAAFLDPKLGIRRTQLFDIPGMVTNYDLFVQPGVTGGSVARGKVFDLGVRANTSYSIPGSRWSVGAIAEVMGSVLKEGGSGSTASGFFSPWTSFTLNPRWSTQHWILLPFQHQKGDPWKQLSWDFPTNMAIIQNGVGVDLTEQLWVSMLINNYLGVQPRLQNTWVSLWLSVTVM